MSRGDVAEERKDGIDEASVVGPCNDETGLVCGAVPVNPVAFGGEISGDWSFGKRTADFIDRTEDGFNFLRGR